MYMKICPDCKKESYSSNKRSWQCPYCNRELNDVKAKIAERE